MALGAALFGLIRASTSSRNASSSCFAAKASSGSLISIVGDTLSAHTVLALAPHGRTFPRLLDGGLNGALLYRQKKEEKGSNLVLVFWSA
jgi:hypothetical protein